jgi:hypothetical protein
MVLKWKYKNISINILDIIYRPVFYLKQKISEAGFRLRLLLSIGLNWVSFT